jgi:HTH-type transcriptional regulator/antitoxin HigA
MTHLNFAKPHLLRSEAEYDRARARLEQLLDQTTAAAREEADFLMLLLEDYDRKHYAIAGTPSPAEVVDFLLEQHGKTRADLAQAFGGRSRVSDFFAGKRELSKAQMAWLHRELGAPLELLLERAPQLEAAAS